MLTVLKITGSVDPQNYDDCFLVNKSSLGTEGSQIGGTIATSEYQ